MSDISDGPSDGRVSIRAPTTQNRVSLEVYADLEEYIYTGFLTSSAEIQGTSFVFKTMSHLEIRYLQMMRIRGQSSQVQNDVFRAAFIANSILFVNGINALVDRQKNMNKLIKMVNKLSAAIQNKIVENLSALNDKATRAGTLVEAYVYEDKSRYRWLQCKTINPNDPMLTGIFGTDVLPLNTCQLTWCAMNRILDTKDALESAWQNAKFIGGCFAGKGMRSVEERDKHRKEMEKKDIEEKKMDMLRKYLNRTKETNAAVEVVVLPDGRKGEVVSRARAETAEELADQLANALNNQKDLHDLAVEEHFKKLNERSEQINNERDRIYQTIPSEGGDLGSRPISPFEAKSRMDKIREAILKSQNEKVVLEEPEV